MSKKTAEQQIQMVEFHVPEKNTPYGSLIKDRGVFSSLTVAALVIAKYLQLTPSGAAFKPQGRRFNKAVFRGIVGPSAANHWFNTTERLDDDGITVKGLNEIHARMNGEQSNSYKTDLDKVKAMIAAVRDGKPVRVKGVDVVFNATIAFKAF